MLFFQTLIFLVFHQQLLVDGQLVCTGSNSVTNFTNVEFSSVTQTIRLSVTNSYTTESTQVIGVNSGVAFPSSNWLKFIDRLGINSVRLFATSYYKLTTLIGQSNMGKFNSQNIINQPSFNWAVQTLRSQRDNTSWWNLINSLKIDDYFNRNQSNSPSIGTNKNTIESLYSLGISTLFVQQIGCSKGPGTQLEFTTMNESSNFYWAERWELYKFSYALALWARLKNVNMIEFYNEPDLSLDDCLNADLYKEYYLVRARSIQDAYSDVNSVQNESGQMKVNLMASAFARVTYGGNSSKYLGDVTVKNNNFSFGIGVNPTWKNINTYSFHTYGKTGSQIASAFQSVVDSVKADASDMPVVITEHNSHTAADWETIPTTADFADESSRLAAQIISLSAAGIKSSYVFKFSMSLTDGTLKKNGLHWSEMSQAPYHISDTTLSAEAMRLLTPLKNSRIYALSPASTSGLSKVFFLASSTATDGLFYVYIVNDDSSRLRLNISLSAWNVFPGSKVLIESVGNGFWGEISSIQTVNSDSLASFLIDSYSTHRIVVQTGSNQSTRVLNSNLACTVSAGSLSAISNCNSKSISVSTSNTDLHETTSLGIIQFNLGDALQSSKRTVLKLNIEEGNSTLLILGLTGFNKQSSQITWDNLVDDFLLTKPSGKISKISQNFINWSSNLIKKVSGHVTARSKSQARYIDVSDYVRDEAMNGATSVTFLLYRPFRYAQYNTALGTQMADDLSGGSIVKLSSTNTSICDLLPQLIQFF